MVSRGSRGSRGAAADMSDRRGFYGCPQTKAAAAVDASDAAVGWVWRRGGVLGCQQQHAGQVRGQSGFQGFLGFRV